MREIGSTIFILMNAVFLIRGLAGESVAAEAGLDVVRAEVDPAGITSRSDVAHRDVALRQILNAWRERQDASRNLHLVWEVDRSGMNRWNTFQSTWDETAPQAENDTGISQVWLGDDTLRYESTRWYFDTRSEFAGYNAPGRPRYQVPLNPRFDQNTKTSFERALSVSLDISPTEFPRPRRCVTILTPETCTEVFEATEATPVCEATIRTADGWLRDDGLLLRPVHMHYRPLVGRAGTVDDRNWRLGPEQVFVNGSLCVLLEERRSPTETDLYCVDPTRNWAVIRWVQERDEKPFMQVDVDYRAEADSTWHPSTWTIQVFAGPDVARDYPGRELIWQTASLRVTKWERDLPVPDGNFDVSLPPGTIVLEESTGRRYLTGEQGDRRILSDAELRRMGLAVARGRFPGWRSAWIVPSVIAGMLLAGAVLRKKWIPGLRRVTTNDCDSAGSVASDEAI